MYHYFLSLLLLDGDMAKSCLLLLYLFSRNKNIVLELNPNDAILIKEAQKILNYPSSETNLVYIHTNFGYLPDIIEKLENQGLPLATSIEIVRNVSEKLNSVSGNTGMLINEKFKNVLSKNKGFEFIQQISNKLIDETTVIDGLPEELSIQDFIYFK